MAASVLQSAVNANTGTTVTATLSAAPTVGNTLVLIANSDNVITNSTPGTWTAQFHYLSDQDFYIWSRPVVSGDGATFTVTPSSPDYVSMVALELPGVGALDVAGTVVTAQSVGSLAAGSVTTTGAGDLVLVAHGQHGFNGTEAASGVSWNNGFTSAGIAIPPAGSTSVKTTLLVGQKVQTAAGAVGATTATWSWSASNVAAVQVGFKAAQPSGSPTVVNATPATVSVAAPAPSLTVATTVQGGGAATVTVTAHAPAVTASTSTVVSATTATATTAAPAPVVSAGATVLAAHATVSLSAPIPVVTAEANVSAVPATATVAAPAPAVTAATGATVSATAATVQTAAPAPTVSVGTVVTATTATGHLVAYAPTVHVPATVQASPAAATVTAYAPNVSVGIIVTAPPAVMSAHATAPMVLAYRSAVLNAPVASVTVHAGTPAVTSGSTQQFARITATLGTPRWTATLGSPRWKATLQ